MSSGGLVLTVPGKLVCGGLAGAVAQSVSYPLDVTRRRMQLACMDAHTAKFGWAWHDITHTQPARPPIRSNMSVLSVRFLDVESLWRHSDKNCQRSLKWVMNENRKFIFTSSKNVPIFFPFLGTRWKFTWPSFALEGGYSRLLLAKAAFGMLLCSLSSHENQLNP